MEFMCPLCFRWTEIREHQVFAGNRIRCGRCGGVLRITSARPFAVEPGSAPGSASIRVGSVSGQEEGQNG